MNISLFNTQVATSSSAEPDGRVIRDRQSDDTWATLHPFAFHDIDARQLCRNADPADDWIAP